MKNRSSVRCAEVLYGTVLTPIMGSIGMDRQRSEDGQTESINWGTTSYYLLVTGVLRGYYFCYVVQKIAKFDG